MDMKQKAELSLAKKEIAAEFGVADFEDIDRGKLTSRMNGNLARALVEIGEEKLMNQKK